MWSMTEPPYEMIFRAVLIYCGLFVMFRLVGKKHLGEMSPFDLVLVLIISESVSNALGAEDNSIPGNLLSAATLLGMSVLIDNLSFKFKKFETFVDGKSLILISDGEVDERVRRSEKITISEIEEALRELKIPSVQDVKIGFLETNGKITAFQK